MRAIAFSLLGAVLVLGLASGSEAQPERRRGASAAESRRVANARGDESASSDSAERPASPTRSSDSRSSDSRSSDSRSSDSRSSRSPTGASVDEEQARRLYLLGDDLYMQGRYEEALVAFEQSYDLSGRPLLLYNMANVHERSGDFDGVLLKLEAYLPHATDQERPRLRSRIESLRDRVARMEQRRRRELEALRRDGPPRKPISISGVLLTIGAAALIGAGVGTAFIARGARNELDAQCASVAGRTVCPPEARPVEKRDLRASLFADGLFIAGGLTFLGGLWLLLRNDDDSEDAPDDYPSNEADRAQVNVYLDGSTVGVAGAF